MKIKRIYCNVVWWLGTQCVSGSMQACRDAWVRWIQKTTNVCFALSAKRNKLTAVMASSSLLPVPVQRVAAASVVDESSRSPPASRSLRRRPVLPAASVPDTHRGSSRAGWIHSRLTGFSSAGGWASDSRWSPLGVLTWATLALALAALLRRTPLFQNSPLTNSNSTLCWPNSHSETHCPLVSTYVLPTAPQLLKSVSLP